MPKKTLMTIQKSNFCQAVKAELKSMKDFVFEEDPRDHVDFQTQATAIDSRWVHRWKGTEIKPRLVAKWYTERIEDLDDVYASTPILVILRTLLAIALALCWTISSADSSTAFLHAPLAEGAGLYLAPPIEFYPEKKVLWKLKKAIYGLRSSPKAWQEHLADTMTKMSFRRLHPDSNVDVHDTGTVSYTHLTLPTKRIV